MLESPTPDRKATILLLLGVAGCVDAVGLGELGRYFVSYMSGNTTSLGLLIADRDYAGALLPAGLIALFVAGAAIGTLVVERAGRASPGLLLLIEGALLAIASIVLGGFRPMAGIVLLPVAMGLANILTLRAGNARPGVTYATSALVKIGIGLAGLGRDTKPADLLFDGAMWLCLLAGSVLGAFGRSRYGAEVLLAPAAICALLGLVDWVAVRPRRQKASVDGR